MKYLKWILLVLCVWPIAYCEIKQIGNEIVEMSTDDLRYFVQQSEELRIIKENQQKKINYYLGVNVGTYGVGVNAGIVF